MEPTPETRERAVRMVLENEGGYRDRSAAIRAISPKIGFSRESLRRWVAQFEIDSGRRDGVGSDERTRIKELEREVRELHGGTLDETAWHTGSCPGKGAEDDDPRCSYGPSPRQGEPAVPSARTEPPLGQRFHRYPYPLGLRLRRLRDRHIRQEDPPVG